MKLAIAIVLALGATVRADNGALIGPPGCIAANDLLGPPYCTPFGMWSMTSRLPDLIIELGANVQHLELDAPPLASARTSGSTTSSSHRTGATAVGGTIRYALGLRNHMYVGVEVAIDGITESGSVTPTPYAYVGGYAVVGVRHRAGPASLSLELAGGFGIVSFDPTATPVPSDDFFPVVEARGRAELWLNPWLAAGATIGTSVIAPDTWSTGAYLAFHIRSYARDR